MSHLSVVPDDVEWRKAKASVGQGGCVELAALPGGEVAVRNSKRLEQGVITYSRTDMVLFVAAAKAGEFDDLIA
ncbi:DUF397 domain-containing protein [Kibdelosporangium philippinense]|uniref:DUF397 domain-containing protein n=1 Tax=Kibdelosporangium philippinense TaxID=211113 RepID=A0ABS8ZMB9_9PSEU|nr:DUF397 domain-containing protein [Kibdelosporangium philippinense]MCE7008717.1 DUF397 domain-containing protein [Kibdelosporangium philippinense]